MKLSEIKYLIEMCASTQKCSLVPEVPASLVHRLPLLPVTVTGGKHKVGESGETTLI